MEVVGLFKNYDYHHVESLETPLVEMSVLSVTYLLTKFVQEVAKPSKERYPPRTLYGIVAAAPCDDQIDLIGVCSYFNVASPSLGNKRGLNEANKTIRMIWISAT